MQIYGIDSNHHHPVTDYTAARDWMRTKNGGRDGFDIVRLGYSARSGKGGLIQDRQAARSLAAWNRLGVPVGVYVYCYDTTPAAATLTMQQTIQAIKGYRLEMPVIYDVEYGTHNGVKNGYKYDDPQNRSNNTAMIRAAMQVVEDAGYYGMVYCSRDFFTRFTDLPSLAAYDKWEAAYVATDTDKVVNGIWQYTSSGTVPGIQGSCDLDVAYKDYPALIRAARLNHLAPAPEIITPQQPAVNLATLTGLTGKDLDAVSHIIRVMGGTV